MCEEDSVVKSLLERQKKQPLVNVGYVRGKNRKKIVDWLMDLVREEGLDMSLVTATMTVMDRVGLRVRKNQLQLLAAAALSMVVKVREEKLEAETIVMYTDKVFTTQEIQVGVHHLNFAVNCVESLSTCHPAYFRGHLGSLHTAKFIPKHHKFCLLYTSPRPRDS